MDTITFVVFFLMLLLSTTAAGLVFFSSDEMPSLRTLYRTFGRDVRTLYRLYSIRSFVKRCHRQNQTIVDLFRSTCEKCSKKTCFIFQDEEWTFQMVDDFSNKIANFFLSQGYCKGDEVALMLHNCPEYVCIWLGLAKIGVVTALINTNLIGESLAQSLNVINAKAFIFGRDLCDAVKGAKPFINNGDTVEFYCFTERMVSTENALSFPAKSLNTCLEEASTNPICPKRYEVGFEDKLLYIYTSGTTGLPKAAVVRHSRILWVCAAFKYIPDVNNLDIIYNTLPMYHMSGGCTFVTVVLCFGGTMILRKKFSASKFWTEAVKHKATVAQYIGEVCRFLLNQPVTEEETQHNVRLMMGNGLRPHIWKEFQDRFRIKPMIEMYGATEGNANVVNMFGKEGAVGFLPRIFSRMHPVFLIKIDIETGDVLRNDEGLCIRCKPGEPGELIGKITSNPLNRFEGYVNKRETDKRVIRDCFEKGDTAFLSGDILVMDEDGYLYFMDRTGDTFRWRGENVSTGGVENVLSAALEHVACAVYGVEIPNVEGRAGMATLQANPKDVDFSELYRNVSKHLPPFAIPLFLRFTPEIEATGTLKVKKVNLQKEGYNPEHISDPLYFLVVQRMTYVPMTKDLYSDIVTGKVNL